MGHIERGIGVEQEREEGEEWGVPGVNSQGPVDNNAQTESVRTSRSQHTHNMHAH